MISHVSAAVDQTHARHLRALGVPVLEGGRSGLRAIGHLLEHARGLPAAPAPPSRPPGSQTRQSLPAWLDASASLALLAHYGIPVAPTRAASSAEAAVAAADAVGYPVVLKTDEPGIEHRARVGGVQLGLAAADDVRRAYADLASRCGRAVAVQPDLRATSRTAAGGELALGVVHDPAVGSIVMVSLGGSRIEELRSRVLALTPLDAATSAGLLHRWERLTGLPAPPGLAEALDGLAGLVAELGPQLRALDINPLLVLPNGVIAVDALVQVRV